jgi:NitT/TauT family transport system substrate-binding protein
MQVVKAGLGEEMAMSKDLWPDHPCCVLVVREEVIGRNPDAVQELTNSLVASGKFISQNVDEAARIGSTFLNQAEDVVKSVLADPKQRVTMNELFPVVDDYEYIQEYMTTKIEAMSKKIELEKFVDTRFAKEAGAT